MDRREKDTFNNSSTLVCVFIVTVTSLLIHCLAMIQTHRLMGVIYEVHRFDGLRCHDIHTEFHNNWYSHSKVDISMYCLNMCLQELMKNVVKTSGILVNIQLTYLLNTKRECYPAELSHPTIFRLHEKLLINSDGQIY
jgi:hypothetical protein